MLIKLKVKFMGYLRQRKKEERTDLTLKLLLVGLVGLLCASFFGNGEGIFFYLNELRFHYYLITLVVIIYCVYNRFVGYSILYIIFAIFCFVSMGYSSQILFNDTKNGEDKFSIFYINSVNAENYEYISDKAKDYHADFTAINGKRIASSNEVSNIIFTDIETIKEGIIRLSATYNAYFVVVRFDDKEMVFVDVDFSKIKEKEARIVYTNLTEFVKLQENPVIMFGDFGITAWNQIFVSFLNTTGLEVKNRIILTDGKFRFNPFTFPTINVIGYKNLGLDKISFLAKNSNEKHPILFRISF